MELAADCQSLTLAGELERALAKYASPGDEPELVVRARLELADPGGGGREASTVWAEANLRYQFVRGVVEPERARFATRDGSLFELDLPARRLRGRLRREVFAAPYSTWADLVAAPLAEAWRAWGLFPLHAACVEVGGRNVALPAASGSGKTTLALALTRGAGARWRGDDKLLLRERGGRVEARSLYGNANVAPLSAAAFPELAFVAGRPPIDETNDKRSVALAELRPGQVDLGPFEIGGLAFPELAPAPGSEVLPIGRTEAFLRLVAQSPVSASPERHGAQLRCLSELARSVPASVVRLGADLLERPLPTSVGIAERLGTP
jgi:hypothetical protein